MVLNSPRNPDNTVRAAGPDTLRKAKGVEQRPEFAPPWSSCRTTTIQDCKLIAASVLEGKRLSSGL
jgi:hypothetical protein